MVSAWSIPQAKRETGASSGSPAPNSYNPPADPSKLTRPVDPQYSLGRAPRSHAQQDERPGPGNYAQVKLEMVRESAPSYSIMHKPAPLEVPSALGPGQYNPSAKLLPHDPSYRIGRAERFQALKDEQGPGPGQYAQVGEDYDGSKSRASRNVVFGKGGRDHSQANLGPGPGAYTLGKDPSKASAPRIGFGGKHE